MLLQSAAYCSYCDDVAGYADIVADRRVIGMPRRYRPGPRHAAFVKGLVAGRHGPAGEAGDDGGLGELRRLAEEGEASGLSEEDGELLLDRLEAKYRSLAMRKSRI